MEERNIALIGFRATGKSSIGRILAERLGWDFVDMDERLAASAGREIAYWVRLDGWASFRKAESELLEKLGGHKGLVVATGGGVVTTSSNRAILKRSFFTVWLKAPVEIIIERIASDPRSGSMRPPLSNLPPGEEIRKLLAEREPLYSAVADLEIETSGKSIEDVAEKLATRLDNNKTIS